MYLDLTKTTPAQIDQWIKMLRAIFLRRIKEGVRWRVPIGVAMRSAQHLDVSRSHQDHACTDRPVDQDAPGDIPPPDKRRCALARAHRRRDEERTATRCISISPRPRLHRSTSGSRCSGRYSSAG